MTSPVVPSMEMMSTFVEDNVGASNLALLVRSVNVERLDAADAGGTHATGNDGRVGRLAAVRGEDALSSNHALEVIGRGLPTHEDGGLAGLLEGLGVSRGEHHGTGRRTGGGVQALGEDLILGLGVKLRVQELVELLRAT